MRRTLGFGGGMALRWRFAVSILGNCSGWAGGWGGGGGAIDDLGIYFVEPSLSESGV